MDDQSKNLILATALSFLVILGWFFLFPPPEQPATLPDEAALIESVPVAEGTPSAAATAPEAGVPAEATAPSAEVPRVRIETPSLSGSISLQGGRIDDLLLNKYDVSLEPDSPKVTLLAPVGTDEPYFALFGWAPGGDLGFEDVPGADTIWTLAKGDKLTPDSPIELRWDNGRGLVFYRTIAVDEDYLFTVTQRVENTGDTAVRLAPHNQIVRIGQPKDQKRFFIIHEGAMRQTGKELQEIDWNDFPDLDADPRWGPHADVEQVEKNGWLGFTDHYWMSMLIPAAEDGFEAVLQYIPATDTYKSIARPAAVTVAPGETHEVSSRLFAGAKEWETLRRYQNELGIYQFVDAIDWGWFFFLTKPIFAVLHWLNKLIGNMGWAIIGLTLIIKAMLFPLAYKSYVSMAKMKELQPEMEKIKERAGDDRQKLQQEMMALYKKEKVNPASGCLPIILQIPIFFSLYKVIAVTIELRHAPWIGWIRDLSSPDPSSILNLFGLMPWDVPDLGPLQFLSLGLLPILLGISMWLQQKLNPAPADPTQRMIFAWMPWVFMFMLGTFASGLVLYWISNNVITFTQQYLIMRSQGYKPDVFGNIMRSILRKGAEPPATKAKPAAETKAKAEPEPEPDSEAPTDTARAPAPKPAGKPKKPRRGKKK